MDFMLCESVDEPFNKENWIAERKYDGSRVRVVIDDEIEKIIVKGNNNNRLKRLPEFNQVRVNGKYVLDGELVYLNDDRVDEFNVSQSRIAQECKRDIRLLSKIKPLKLVIFDVLEKGSKDLRDKILKERLEDRKEFFESVKRGKERLVNVGEHRPQELWDKIVERGLEGIIMKNLNSTYAGERSNNWLKVKYWKEKVMEFSKYEEHSKGITIENEDEIRVAVLGEQSNEVRRILEDRGRVKAEIQYLNESKYGKLRQPSFKGVVK